MKRMNMGLGGLFWSLVGVNSLTADIVYDNGVPDLGNAWHSDFDRSKPYVRSQRADDFVLNADAVITKLYWWGAYGLDNIPPALDDFSIRVFEVINNVPDTIPLYEVEAGHVRRVDSGDDILGVFDIYEYSVIVPEIVLKQGSYLFSVVNDTTGTGSDWFWAQSAPIGNDKFRVADKELWTSDDSEIELAFILADVCIWDLDADGSIGAPDLLSLLVQWGTDPGGPPDFDGDGSVGASDLLALLANWGPCP